MTDQCDCGIDAGAYVLGALEHDELEAFRLHMAGCPACRAEVASLQRVADSLPAAASVMPAPVALRRRVIDAVRQEAQAAATTHHRLDLAAPGEQQRHAGDRQDPGTTRSSTRRRRFAWPRPAAAVAGVVAAAIAVVVLLNAGGPSSTRVIHASVRGPGSAELRVTGGRGDLTVSRLPAPGTGRIYQVWLQRPNAAPTPTRTLFDVTARGRAEVRVGGDLHGVRAVLVTSEPRGGSIAPTRSPVISARLS